jgi:hypothetical protein
VLSSHRCSCGYLYKAKLSQISVQNCSQFLTQTLEKCSLLLRRLSSSNPKLSPKGEIPCKINLSRSHHNLMGALRKPPLVLNGVSRRWLIFFSGFL